MTNDRTKGKKTAQGRVLSVSDWLEDVLLALTDMFIILFKTIMSCIVVLMSTPIGGLIFFLLLLWIIFA